MNRRGAGAPTRVIGQDAVMRGLGRVVLRMLVVLGVGVVLVTPMPATSRAEAAGTTKVTLLAPGKAPRSPLLLTMTEGTVVPGSIQFTESIEQSLDGVSLNSVAPPPMRIGLSVTVGPVAPNGDGRISYGYTGATVVDDGTLSSAQIDQYNTAIAPLTSLRGTGTVTARNEFVDGAISGTEALDPALSQVVSQLSDQVGSFSTPFPRQAIGIGARWRATSSIEASGMSVRQTYDFTLRERDETRVVVDVKFAQTAPRQRAEFPGMPAGAKVVLTKWKVTGTGSSTIDLTQPYVPVASEAHATGSQTFDVHAQGEQGTLVQKLELNVRSTR